MFVMSFIIIFALTLSSQAIAYVGPGAGVTMLGALWGVILAIVLALVGILYWPIHALIRRSRKTTTTKQTTTEESNHSRGK